MAQETHLAHCWSSRSSATVDTCQCSTPAWSLLGFKKRESRTLNSCPTVSATTVFQFFAVHECTANPKRDGRTKLQCLSPPFLTLPVTYWADRHRQVLVSAQEKNRQFGKTIVTQLSAHYFFFIPLLTFSFFTILGIISKNNSDFKLSLRGCILHGFNFLLFVFFHCHNFCWWF